MTDQPTEPTTTEPGEPEPEIMVTTLISGATNEGRVQVELPSIGGQPGFRAQFSITEAREFALNMLEASVCAHADAFIFSFFTQTVGLLPEAAVALLQDFREFREASIAVPPEGVELRLGPDQVDPRGEAGAPPA